MRCPYCSTQNDEGTEYCSNCGEELSLARAHWSGPQELVKKSSPSQVSAAYDEYDPAKLYSEPRAMSRFVPPTNYPAYLGWSIWVLLLCSPPTGLIALIFSLQVRRHNEAGDDRKAFRYSQLAKMWCWISVVIGIAFYVTLFMLLMHYVAGYWAY